VPRACRIAGRAYRFRERAPVIDMAHAAPNHHRHHLRLSESEPSASTGRTSGLDAIALPASAPFAIRDLQSDIDSQNR
jgi:hypothetical protein